MNEKTSPQENIETLSCTMWTVMLPTDINSQSHTGVLPVVKSFNKS